MEQKIRKILQDIYLIAPELREREEELKKTVEKLLSSKPERELDPGFKKELLDKILLEYGKQEAPKQVKRVFYLRTAFITAAAASLLILALGIALFLPQKGTKKPVTVVAHDQTQKTDIQQPKTPVKPPEPPPRQPVKTQSPKPVEQPPKPVMAKAKEAKSNLEVVVRAVDGSLIPGASVTLTGKKGNKKTSVSNEKGVVAFNELPSGKYQLIVYLEGFKRMRFEEVQIVGSQDVSLDVPLEIATISEEIVVAGKAPTVTTTSSKTQVSAGIQADPQAPPKARNTWNVDGVDVRKSGTGVSSPQYGKLVKSHRYQGEDNTESYDYIKDNNFINPLENPLSTFSIDVDTASYSNVRRFLMNRRLPPVDAVRIEELINYFPYDYPIPRRRKAFSITTELSICPWKPAHHLVLIGMKGKEMQEDRLPPSNLVFLLDVSGSMNHPQKLPLLVEAFKLLTHELQPEDQVSIVVYAGSAGLVLPPTSGNNKDAIFEALNRLRAGGSTAGGQGIILAYDTAEKNVIENGNNRVILATDGDFNVGPSSDAEMVRLIEEKRKKGIFLTVLGFGMGNYKDSKMEKLADKGNGNYFYIDSMLEANKVLVHDLRKTLFTIAKDVKIQVEFNPARVKAYRLVGYENRLLQKEEFDDDTKDAGEIGAGHTVTALYEIIPRTRARGLEEKNELKYQQNRIKSDAFESLELMNIKIRYKKPDANKSSLITKAIKQKITSLENTSNNFRFASSAAEFGLLLRNSQYKGEASLISVLKRALGSLGEDKYGYRKEFIKLVKIVQDINKASVDE
jgi:Ca-activated chloride channel family protein